MPEWFNALIPTAAELPTPVLVAKLFQSALLGLIVAAIYFLTQRKGRSDAVPFVATLVLLTVLIGMVTRVIGDNTARAFSLAGALAIIRFRTVVDDTRDTAFVIAAVVTGMAAGAGMLDIAIAGLPVLAVAAVVLNYWGGGFVPRQVSSTLIVRIGVGLDPTLLLSALLTTHLDNYRLLSVETAKQGAALELKYNAALKSTSTAIGFIGELNRIEGVQGVEWKENGVGK